MHLLSKYKTALIIFISLAIFFAINILIKLNMFGLYTNTAQESWLSGVSTIYINNWLQEGIVNLQFAMVRTFDSVEMRGLQDREVYSSFLPGSLFMPYLIAKLFSIKVTVIYMQLWACFLHFLAALLAAWLSFKLSVELALSKNKALVFSIITGFLYIYGYLNFMMLDFAYFADTTVFVVFLVFLFSEFIKDPKKRLLFKAIVLFVGFFNEWFFASITVVSLVSELLRKENRGSLMIIISSHLGPAFCALSIYLYQLNLLGKFQYAYERMLLRTCLNPSLESDYKQSFSFLWKDFYDKHGALFNTSFIFIAWVFTESKYFKKSSVYKNIFVISFVSAFVQIFVAFQHSSYHYFGGIKLLIPIAIFAPIIISEITEYFFKKRTNLYLTIAITALIVSNTLLIIPIIKKWEQEHPIYAQLKEAFKDYGHEDIFFSYNIEVLLDRYNKKDIKSTSEIDKASDKHEGEPFTYLATNKQIYSIEKASDLLPMIENRELEDKAKLHLVFYKKICNNVKENFKEQITQTDDLYIIDLDIKRLKDKSYLDKIDCDGAMKSTAYFCIPSDK